MGGPGSEQLAGGDDAEGWVAPDALEVGGLQMEVLKLVQTMAAEGGELVEQFRHGAPGLAQLRFAVEGIKGPGGPSRRMISRRGIQSASSAWIRCPSTT